MKPVDLLLHLEAYIALESALGFSLRARESLLRDFVAFVEASAIRELISAQIALDWACSASEHCALWLGHESIETTHIYVEADLAIKERALERIAPANCSVRRFKADDTLLAFLASL